MKFRSIIRIVGLLVVLFSGFLLFPGIIALIYRDGGGVVFFNSFCISIIIGLLLWFPNRYHHFDLNIRDGFLIVVLFWVGLGTISAVPFLIDDHVNLNITNSFFEAFSSLTTTGGSIMENVDSLPKAILFYRQMLQWIGGMGIIVLAVAVLPLLGIGGMQIYRAEIPGPEKNKRMRPRVAQTAKTLWLIYLFLTLLCCFSFWFAGMDLFDAVCHAFSVLALSGGSTHDASFAYFNSPLINSIAGIFMILAACSFNLHFSVVTQRSLLLYWKDQEFRFFILTLGTIILIVFGSLFLLTGKSGLSSLDAAFFNAVSIMCTAGFTTEDIAYWPLFLPVLLFISSFIGGCAGSTGGGLKVIRVLLLFMQGSRELKRLVHPQSIYMIKFGGQVLPERTIEAIWGFFSAYAFVFIISLLLILTTGVDFLTGFSIIAAGLNNLGAGLGEVSGSFASMTSFAKWIMIIDMLFGRLEIFTLLVIFTPTFWRD